jgi:hypothetical protein
MQALIHVTLIDADSGATLTEAEIPSHQLPATFVEPATLSLGGDNWSVVKAFPLTAAERLKSGHLRLELSRELPVSPQEILFTLPTISHELPVCEPGAGALVLHEDDWRQIELYAGACDEAVATCLERIERVCREKRHPSGAFEELHIRREVPEPLVGTTVTMEALRAAFPRAVELDGVSVRGSGRVKDGFAWRLGAGICVHGFFRDGRAEVLALAQEEPGAALGSDAAALAGLMSAHGLRLVSWCRRAIAADETALANVI